VNEEVQKEVANFALQLRILQHALLTALAATEALIGSQEPEEARCGSCGSTNLVELNTSAGATVLCRACGKEQ
jgi:hypothetical protein